MPLPTGTLASRARANTVKRQKLKSKWDKKCRYETDSPLREVMMEGTLFASDIEAGSTKEENWCRLLDEGVVVDNSFWTGEPYVFAVIRKGVLKQWYESLPDNFVGTIDKDHNRSIGLGKFTKKDLRLVETEDGRYAVDVNVKLDHELYAVKDLIRENNRTALSVEMFINADEYAKASKVTGEKLEDDYLVPLIDDLKIEGYAVCIAPKSANSYKDGLLEKASADINNNKESVMNKKLKKVDAKAEDAKATEGEEETTNKADLSGGVPPEENTEPENTDEGTDEGEETEGEGEEPETEGTEPENTDEGEGDGEDGTDEEEADDEEGDDAAKKLSAAIDGLKKSIKEKDAKIAELEAKLSKKEAQKKDYENKLTDLFNFATSDDPAEEEGGATTDDEKEGKKDDFETALEAEFNKMEG